MKNLSIKRNEKGITLIALLITVIIMLILAGVAISVLTGSDNLLSKTRDVADVYQQEAQNEADKVQSLMNEIDNYLGEISAGIDIATDSSINVGDFVNYSVTVDGTVYDKWRILHKDTNGHVEIVCYNGPSYTLGERSNVTKSKSDYANCISLLNDASVAYKNGTYGYSARHLGSNPSNPSSYATIDESYVKYYSDYSTISSNVNYPYIVQKHHTTDINALKTFSGTKKLSGSYSWLASRSVNASSSYSRFRLRLVSSGGSVYDDGLYAVFSDGTEYTYSRSDALAPVVSLQSGVKAIPGSGDGSEGSPWQLTL